MKVGNEMEIREIRKCDYEQVIAIENSIWNDQNTPNVSRYSSVDEYQESLQHRKVIVACEKNEILGFLDMFQGIGIPSARFCLDIGIGISPEAQRQGVASALLQWTIDYAKKKGYHKLSLRVLETNPEAMALYKKNGFVVEGILKDAFYLGNQWVNDILMAYFLEHTD